MIKSLFAVIIGGSVGCTLRWLLSTRFNSLFQIYLQYTGGEPPCRVNYWYCVGVLLDNHTLILLEINDNNGTLWRSEYFLYIFC